MPPEASSPSSAPEPIAPPADAARREPVAPRSWTEIIWRPIVHRRLSGFLASVVLHLLVVLLLALTYFARQTDQAAFPLLLHSPELTDEEPLTTVELPIRVFETPVETPAVQLEALEEPDLPELFALESNIAVESEPQSDSALKPDQGERRARHSLARRPGQGGGLEGRSDKLRASLVGRHGGTPASEDAVALGLAWLALHQRNNGSWHFDHRGDACDHRCENPGTAATTTGATALALLPFLGAGQSHQHGEHREVVKQGLYYLQGRMRRTPHGGDLMEGTMYAQGLAAIALCEAYALTKDEELRPFAQEAVDYICYAQHPEGGWRYFPGQPGDTTVFGWQFMALKSASLANLEISSPVIERAERYLDSVQTNGGANYGYLKPAADPTPTAVGLLSRMYLGWPRDKPELGKGIAFLAKRGPSAEDMYFNYYATQVLHHVGGDPWVAWNAKLRDYLIKTQATAGHGRGSWFFPDKHGLAGGRLYNTALCVMILEVYYRHLPLYGERTVDEGF